MNNEPAFPTQHANYSTGDHCGMTLRDYFAAKAMQAFLTEYPDFASFARISEWSYNLASEMLKAREK